MWISQVILLAVVAVQAGQNAVARSTFNQDSQIQLSGKGIIRKNGRTSLKIQVEIGPAGGQGGGAGAGEFPATGARPPGMGGRKPGGRIRPPWTGARGRHPGAGAGAGVGAGRPGAGWGGPGAGVGGQGVEEEGPGAGTEGPGEEGPEAGIGGEFTEEEQTGLMKHNEFRAIHEAPPMKLDRKMCNEAKKYAQRLAQMGTLQHSSRQERNGQGENLSMGCHSRMAQAMETAVENWYNEVCDPGYDFNNGGFSAGTGHFTQVVWKESTVLGVGRAEVEKTGMKCAYIVGRYKPAGNMRGKFAENVVKGSFDNSYCLTVGKGGRKFFDEQGRPVIVNSTMSAVDVPSEKTGPAEFPGQQVTFLNDKKKSLVGNQKDKQ